MLFGDMSVCRGAIADCPGMGRAARSTRPHVEAEDAGSGKALQGKGPAAALASRERA